MLNRATRLWICSLILALLGQLGWAVTMPMPTAATLHGPSVHHAHDAQVSDPHAEAQHAQAQHSGADHCAPTPNASESSTMTGHACCPFVGLAPSPAWALPVGAPPSYDRAVAHAAVDGLPSAIFKPPKTPI